MTYTRNIYKIQDWYEGEILTRMQAANLRVFHNIKPTQYKTLIHTETSKTLKGFSTPTIELNEEFETDEVEIIKNK